MEDTDLSYVKQALLNEEQKLASRFGETTSSDAFLDTALVGACTLPSSATYMYVSWAKKD